MRLEYTFTSEDYVRFAERCGVLSPESRAATRRGYFTAAALMTAAAVALQELWGTWRGPLLIGGIACMFPLASYTRSRRARQAIRLVMEQARQNGRFGTRALIISPQGVATEQGTETIAREWQAVSRVVMEGPDVALYLDPPNVIIVPASAFGDDSQRHAFLEAVIRYREQAANTEVPS